MAGAVLPHLARSGRSPFCGEMSGAELPSRLVANVGENEPAAPMPGRGRCPLAAVRWCREAWTGCGSSERAVAEVAVRAGISMPLRVLRARAGDRGVQLPRVPNSGEHPGTAVMGLSSSRRLRGCRARSSRWPGKPVVIYDPYPFCARARGAEVRSWRVAPAS